MPKKKSLDEFWAEFLKESAPFAPGRVENGVLIKTCPVEGCGREFRETTDRYGEQTSDRYGNHYRRVHGER